MKFLSKRNVLIASSILVVVSLLIMEELGVCRSVFQLQTTCFIPAKDSLEVFIFIFALLASPSLLTLPLKSSVFEAWKRRAAWMIPVILLITAAVLNGEGGGSGFGLGYESLAYIVLLGIPMTVYFIRSLVVIIIEWRRSVKNGLVSKTFRTVTKILVPLIFFMAIATWYYSVMFM